MKIAVIQEWENRLRASEEAEEDCLCGVVLAWEGAYRKGDRIEFSDLQPGEFYVVKADAALEEALVFVDRETIVYQIPFYEKKESMNPLAFCGSRHYLSIRRAQEFEIKVYRNLARNPFDQHEASGVYPHASANVETRGESVFAAKNAIDGVLAAKQHGEWPFASWGINRKKDAAFMLDFGRAVDFDRIVLYTRADFPHDSYWTKAVFTFSDGSTETVHMEKKVQKPHIFGIKREGITWLKLDQLEKAPDDSPFPALTQIEVYGTEHRAFSEKRS